MSHTVIGLFKSRNEAEQAISVLESRGFDSSSIDVSTSSNSLGEDSLRAGNNYSDTNDLNLSSSNTEEDGIGTFFTNLFGGAEKDEVKTYTNAARQSDAIVTVHAENDIKAKEASEILDARGAIDAYEEEGHITASSSESNISRNEGGTSDVAKVIREELEVGKREVEEGGMRLRSRIVERPIEESIRLRSEHVTVKRTPVNRLANEADFKDFHEGEMELTEVNEVPVVSKAAYIIEEVSLGKEVTERTETVKDSVRNTEVDVEKIPSKNEGEK